MQPGYRVPHAATSRRGIGPMLSGPHPPNSMTPAQIQAQQTAQQQAIENAKRRSRKPTDKNIPDGVEECIIGDGVQRYRDLRDFERRLDAAVMRKRLDAQDAMNRNVKCYRTLRIWISNTVEDQPWQGDSLDVDAFDFSTNLDSSFRVKIEGRLLEEEEEEADSDDDDDAPTKESEKTPSRPTYKFSHFFKSMTVEFERNRTRDGSEQSVEWKKPTVAANAPVPPNSADFDQLEFKRSGDENQNITINLVRDETPERFRLSPTLAEIMDTTEATRAEVVMGIWQYIRILGLSEDEEKRSFRCDDLLRQIMQRDVAYIPHIPEAIVTHMSPLPPIKLPYTIRVDSAYHTDPTPTVYDVLVSVPDPLQAKLASLITNPSYPTTLREISTLNDQLAVLVQAVSHSKAKHVFFTEMSKDPGGFVRKWLSSQRRDLEAMMGEGMRGGGEDAGSEEWRKGGSTGVWGSSNARESVNLLLSTRGRL